MYYSPKKHKYINISFAISVSQSIHPLIYLNILTLTVMFFPPLAAPGWWVLRSGIRYVEFCKPISPYGPNAKLTHDLWWFKHSY